MPAAERVRFTASGTEATLLALRLACAHTGRDKIVRLKGHYHGWHDNMATGYVSHFDGTPPPGLLREVADRTVLVNPDDPHALEAAVQRDDVAAVFVEPTGASFGMVPLHPDTLRHLRAVTEKSGALLIFDEVISGFRVAAGGAQGVYGIAPDLTTLAKIVAGGTPGGAVAGKKAILDHLEFDTMAAAGQDKVLHPGTFNANPVSAAAGITALEIIESGEHCERANAVAASLRQGFNRALAARDVPWSVYGMFSGFHFFMNPDDRAVHPEEFDPFSVSWKELKTKPTDTVAALRLAWLLEGVDISGWPGGMTSAVHSDDDIGRTVEAFARALDRMDAESLLVRG